MKFKSEEERFKKFLLRIKKDKNGCWNWTGAKDIFGYGKTRINYKSTLMHRYFYEKFIEDIPKNKCVLHKCNNPSCVNPKHLYIGTPKDNGNDKSVAGSSKEEKNGRAKVNANIVLKIRNDYIPKERGILKFLCNKYNLGERLVQKIVYRETWKHI